MSLAGWLTRLGREGRPDLSAWRETDRKREALAGVVCAFLVIPQAITFAYLAGLPPEFGLHSAIFVVLFASLLGTTPMPGGPNTATSILLGSAILPFAGRGSPLYIEYVLLLSLVVGVVQLLIWLLRGAELFRYFSPSAISGIKTGVGILLISSAVEGALGMASITTPFFREKIRIAVVSWGDLANPYAVAVSAVTVAVLGLSQSLVIAQDLKAEFGSRVSLGREVFAQGVSNALAPSFSGFAGSGSFNRTMVAVETGGRTWLTGVASALGVVVAATTLGPVLTWLPMATIAGIVVLVGIGMIQVRDARRFVREPVDGTIFGLTVLVITFLGLEAGIAAAVFASLGFFVAGASKLRFVVTHDDDLERIQVTGNLFFASMDALGRHLADHPSGRTRLDLSRVPYCDSAALGMIEKARRERAASGGELEVVRAG